jgi:hypothetical protein
VVRTGRRAAVLADGLCDAGLQPAPVPSSPPRLADVRGAQAEELVDLYRRLGGVQEIPALRPGAWDLTFSDSLVVELDEELHFNRYRAVTLLAPWAESLPWTGEYVRHCEAHQDDCLSAGTWGKRWTNPSCERMFGAAGPAGELRGAGAPRWKQRALYDAMKDLAATIGLDVRVARVSVHDTIDGHRLADVLEGYALVSPESIRQLVSDRTA